MVIVEGLISFVFVIRSCSKSTVDSFCLRGKEGFMCYSNMCTRYNNMRRCLSIGNVTRRMWSQAGVGQF